jgi:hypothetical protein
MDVHAGAHKNVSSYNTDREIAFVENCLAFGFLHFELLKMVLKMESASELPWRQDGFLYLMENV